MASSRYGAKVLAASGETGGEGGVTPIFNYGDLKTFRALPRRQASNKQGTFNDFQKYHSSICTYEIWVSRKRIRHDMLRLYREGLLPDLSE